MYEKAKAEFPSQIWEDKGSVEILQQGKGTTDAKIKGNSLNYNTILWGSEKLVVLAINTVSVRYGTVVSKPNLTGTIRLVNGGLKKCL